jgi:small subunit ribosomal protein S20
MMANIKSAKKKAKQDEVRRVRNAARKSSIKTAMKKVETAVEKGEETQVVLQLLRDAESQIARAKGKGVLKPNTAARRVSRLARLAKPKK